MAIKRPDEVGPLKIGEREMVADLESFVNDVLREFDGRELSAHIARSTPRVRAELVRRCEAAGWRAEMRLRPGHADHLLVLTPAPDPAAAGEIAAALMAERVAR